MPFTLDPQSLGMVHIEKSGFAFHDDEMVPDHRAEMTPSEVVQSKLLKLIPDMAVPVSCMHTFRDTRRRFSGTN